MKQKLLLAAALAAIPLAALAQEQAAPTMEQIVNMRQSKMGRGGGALGQMKNAADSGADLTTLAPRIESLIQWSDELPTLFPEGSNVSDSAARPEVWTDRAGFDAAAERFRTAARALAAPAAANDRAAFLDAWTQARATCNGCHTGYKS